MLWPTLKKSTRINKIVTNGNEIICFSDRETLKITVYDKDIFRISVTQSEDRIFLEGQGEEFLPASKKIDFELNETEDELIVSTSELVSKINRNTGSISFFKDGKLLFSEASEEPHHLESFDVYKSDGNIKVEEIKTADGVKKRIAAADKIYDRTLFHTKLQFDFQNNEKLYGLGQAEEGIWNLRGTTQYLHQANKKIAIPFLVSNLGYGIIFTTQSPSIFSDSEYGSWFYTTADKYLDYFFTAPPKKSQITEKMRQLTGKALELPDWAFGYVQSQERYESQQEILDTVSQFKKRNIPLSMIVLDWLSWEDGMWGQKSFDKSRFPDVAKMIEELHQQNVRFMISIWPSMDEKCQNYKEMKEHNTLLSGVNICDVFKKEGRELYWKQTNVGLAKYGIDAWWCDSSEPVTPEWNHNEKQLPQIMFTDFVNASSDIMPIEKANAYGYYHSKGIYEGQTKDYPERPVLNLTRNGYFGSQKYGVVVWSGDISATWKVLQNQVVAAIQFSLSGLPYWTLDIGAFFVKKGVQWYWDGDYPDATKNPGYRELYTRWLQFAVFLPMFRAHGTDCRREPWAFEDENNLFYNTIKKFINLRYELLPYILDLKKKVAEEDKMMISPLFINFEDESCQDISNQYMFGPKMMICPVTKPMYFGKDGKLLDEEKVWSVYLPSDCNWKDYWTGKKYKGGQWIKTAAPIDIIPVFLID